MNPTDRSSRRSFLKVGAAVAAPLLPVFATAFAGNGTEARLARLEDENALHRLHQTWLYDVNTARAGSKELGHLVSGTKTAKNEVRRISEESAELPESIKFATGGASATRRFHCQVEVETPISKDCTLAQMAHLQGGGFVRRIESLVLIVDYAKQNGAWSIAKISRSAA